MVGKNSANSEAAARPDAEKRWEEQLENWKISDQEREERKRQRKAQRQLDERLLQFAAAMREQASWRGTHNRPKN